MIPQDCRYLASHEWARKEGDLVVVGITDFAVKHLTDLVFLSLPEVGDRIQKGERYGEIESVKAVSDLNAPLSGEVVEVHDALKDELETIAGDPYGAGWMIKLRPANPAQFGELLDPAAYEKVTEAADH